MVAQKASRAMLCCTSLPPACPELDQALAVACKACRVGRNAVQLALAVPGHAAMLILHIWGQGPCSRRPWSCKAFCTLPAC